MDYSLPIKQLANWFDEIVVTRKREEISILLKNLMHKYNPDSHLALPDITFPTLHGKNIFLFYCFIYKYFIYICYQ